MTTSTKPLHEERIEEPARFVNWFTSERDAVFQNGERHKAGVWHSPNVWPSKDVAVTKAHEHLIEFAGWVADNGIEYLGAFPEGQRP